MKRSKKTIIFLLVVLVTICLFGFSISSKIEHIESHATTWLIATGQPTKKTNGNLGDIYLDKEKYDLYQLTKEGWELIGNIKGIDGKDGITPTIEISDDGYWIINGLTTNNLAIGSNGKDAISPAISVNDDGYWVINGKVTNTLAIAQNGKDGKDGENGKDGSAGKDGKDGIDGQDGTNGKDGLDGMPGADGTMWYFGKGQPSSSIGKNGDCYLDKATSSIYQKIDGQWINVAAMNSINDNWNDDDTLKILAIGNSFSDDTMEYVYQIATNLGVTNVKLGNLYVAGCSLETHLTNAQNDAATYTYRTNSNGTWNDITNYKLSDAIKSENWDYITFQQSSGDSGITSTYNFLGELIEIVRPLNDTAKFAWNMTWAYQSDSSHSAFSKYNNDQMTMYNSIVSAVKKKIDTNTDIDLVVPVGTAIQNARTSTVGDTLTRDGYHLTYDLGRYIAGVTFVAKLTSLDYTKLSYAPNGISEEEIAITKEVVKTALASPYDITKASEDAYLKLLDYEITNNAYYNATYDDGSGTIDVQALHVTGWMTKYYAATNIFTRDDLPIGSVIVLEDGWEYRPEGWLNETDLVPTSKRPENVTTSRVVITEEWWADWNYRAFNIKAKGNTIDIGTLTKDEIKEKLKIYVPNNKIS